MILKIHTWKISLMAVTVPIKITWMIEALINHLGIVCLSIPVFFQATLLPKDTTAT